LREGFYGQCGFLLVAGALDRSKPCVITLAASVLSAYLRPHRPNHGKIVFSASGVHLQADQAKEEWIGRTETMQIHFVTCVSAPFKGANCAPGFSLQE
jgi:hypothetical protein